MNLVTDWLLVYFLCISTYFVFYWVLVRNWDLCKAFILMDFFCALKGYRLYWWVSHTEPVLSFWRNAQPTPLLCCTRTTFTISHVSSCVLFSLSFSSMDFSWDVLLDLIDYLDINYFFLFEFLYFLPMSSLPSLLLGNTLLSYLILNSWIFSSVDQDVFYFSIYKENHGRKWKFQCCQIECFSNTS